MGANPDLASLLRVRRTSSQVTPQVPTETQAQRPRTANASLDDRCEVLRFLTLQDETGGVSEVWTQAGCYPCRVETRGVGGENSDVEGQTQSASPYIVYLPRFAQVAAEDRLGVPGWFNVWQSGGQYHQGDRVLLSEADGYVWEAMTTTAGVTPPNESNDWKRARRVSFLEIDSVLDAVTDEDVLIVNCKEVTS